ncbi:MAG: hypothetical protein JWO95_284 [Verrucomicrobiales bacterium]|nr:hypothetical protein [Verrucomicrobiales bacterium]
MKLKFSIIQLTCWLLLQHSLFGGISVVGSLARTQDVEPGKTFEGDIMVQNNGDTAADVRIHQRDYLFLANGQNTYGDPGSAPRSNAGWFTVSPPRLTVRPHESLSVHYRGTAPANPLLNGTYWSIIVVEPATPPPSSIDPKDPDHKLGIHSVIRFAVQIVTEVPGGRPNLKVAGRKLLKAEGRQTLQVDLENTGEKLLIPAVWAELFDAKGASIGKFQSNKARIYPGCSVRHLLDFSKAPKGDYTALLVMDGGGDQVMAAQYQLNLE